MSNVTEDFIYQLPGKDARVEDILFNLPQQFTDGAFINIWLFGFFGITFLTSLRFRVPAQNASLFASFGTFIITFLFTLAGFAGGNQLIPALLLVLVSLAWNYTSSRGGASV